MAHAHADTWSAAPVIRTANWKDGSSSIIVTVGGIRMVLPLEEAAAVAREIDAHLYEIGRKAVAAEAAA